ncbi:MAG: hypothetical protein ABJA16_05560 [Nakamurella sp.]
MARNARLARLRLIPAVTVIGAVLAVSGCAAGQIAQTANQVAAIDGANGTTGALGVRDVRLAPTTDNVYQAGADIPLKLWVSNAAPTSDTLTGVSSTAADSVVVSGNAEILGKTLVEITDATDTTIVVTGLKEELHYGKSIPVTFTFASSGAVTVNVPMEIPAARATGTRETVNILPGEHGNIWFGGSEGESTAGH